MRRQHFQDELIGGLAPHGERDQRAIWTASIDLDPEAIRQSKGSLRRMRSSQAPSTNCTNGHARPGSGPGMARRKCPVQIEITDREVFPADGIMKGVNARVSPVPVQTARFQRR